AWVLPTSFCTGGPFRNPSTSFFQSSCVAGAKSAASRKSSLEVVIFPENRSSRWGGNCHARAAKPNPVLAISGLRGGPYSTLHGVVFAILSAAGLGNIRQPLDT